VLSGFVLTFNCSKLSDGHARWRFDAARFARIYPVVLLALVIAAIGVTYAYGRSDLLLAWYALHAHVDAALGVSLAPQLTMTTGWFPLAAIYQPWNGPAWSIACEMSFYPLFPLLLVALRRRPGRQLLLICGAGWAAQAAWIFALKVFVPVKP
jgi:peptidoglycan/LPS O-acetylase OafA/YrhL